MPRALLLRPDGSAFPITGAPQTGLTELRILIAESLCHQVFVRDVVAPDPGLDKAVEAGGSIVDRLTVLPANHSGNATSLITGSSRLIGSTGSPAVCCKEVISSQPLRIPRVRSTRGRAARWSLTFDARIGRRSGARSCRILLIVGRFWLTAFIVLRRSPESGGCFSAFFTSARYSVIWRNASSRFMSWESSPETPGHPAAPKRAWRLRERAARPCRKSAAPSHAMGCWPVSNTAPVLSATGCRSRMRTLRISVMAWYATTRAMVSATAGSSQYQPPVARIIAPVAATPAAAAASAVVSSRTAATDSSCSSVSSSSLHGLHGE